MTIPTVDLDSGTYSVYADIEDAEEYLGAASHATEWEDVDEDDQAKYLVSATRMLDRQIWPGDKAVSDQPLAWPRISTGIDGVVADTIPTNIINACMELANALQQGYDQNQQTTAERVRSMTAGSVSITNFRGVDTPTRFPLIVQELIAPYLGASSGTGLVSQANGVDEETIFPVDLGYSTGGI
jgi:Putative DnaT-like ssDNA binding protein